MSFDTNLLKLLTLILTCLLDDDIQLPSPAASDMLIVMSSMTDAQQIKTKMI